MQSHSNKLLGNTAQGFVWTDLFSEKKNFAVLIFETEICVNSDQFQK